jgi:hypothetical protein
MVLGNVTPLCYLLVHPAVEWVCEAVHVRCIPCIIYPMRFILIWRIYSSI